MASFEFRLGRLRRVRDIQEREARNLWAAAEEVARNHQEVADHIAQEIVNARLELGRAQVEEQLEVGAVLHSHDLIARLEERLVQATELAKTSQFQADELQRSWMSAKSDARALERLEERAEQEHQRAEMKLENDKMNEIAIARAFSPEPRDLAKPEETIR